MKRFLLLFFFLFFFGSAQAQICNQFAEDLGFDNWNNQGICLGVSREVDHKCYSYVANKRKLDCSIPSSDGWSCKKGYVKNDQKCEADTYVPKNAIKTATGWSCNYNYLKNSSGNACKLLPSNSYKTSESSFRCNYGYEKNISGSGCILKKIKQPKTKPNNSYFTNLTAQGWKCRGGYVQDNNKSTDAWLRERRNGPAIAKAMGAIHYDLTSNTQCYFVSQHKGHKRLAIALTIKPCLE